MPERVRYVVLEDDDEVSHPNVFEMPGPSGLSMRLADIKERFPLAGQFHFRFKRRVGNRVVWQDIGDDQEIVPRFDDFFFIQATRLNAGDDEGRLGAIKSFLAGLGDDDAGSSSSGAKPSASVAGVKSFLAKACSSAGLFSQEEQQQQQRSPPSYSQSYSDRPSRRTAEDNNNIGVSAPATSGNRPKVPSLPRFKKTSTQNKSTPDLTSTPPVSKTLPNKSASPPKPVVVERQQQQQKPAVVPPAPVALPPPKIPPPLQAPSPPADLLGFDSHSPKHNQQQQPEDWHAFVGLDSAAASEPQQPQPMRHSNSVPHHLDPFAMTQQPPAPSRQPSQTKTADFDAFAGF